MTEELTSNRERFNKVVQKYIHTIPVDVVSIAEDLGIDVYEVEIDNPKISGYISTIDQRPFICVNKSHPATRKLFTIAHEIGHFVLHEDILKNETFVPTFYKTGNGIDNTIMARTEDIINSQAYKDKETQANRFAADLLMPEAEFIKQINICDSLQELAQVFKVSVGAASIRACSLGCEIF